VYSVFDPVCFPVLNTFTNIVVSCMLQAVWDYTSAWCYREGLSISTLRINLDLVLINCVSLVALRCFSE